MYSTLSPLQTKGPPDEVNRLEPLPEDDPSSFDLLAPNETLGVRGFSLEKRAEANYTEYRRLKASASGGRGIRLRVLERSV